MASALIAIANEDELTKLMKENQGCLFTLHFWASWAAQCEQMNTVLEELAKDTKLVHVKFIKVKQMQLESIALLQNVAA